MVKHKIELTLNAEAQELFDAYERHTRVTPEVYIGELVDKTLPTLRAMVEAFEECGDDTEAAMEVFGRKMGEVMLRRVG
ncbi:MAG: hypothetical protein HWE39_10820 [Oceanospirillaceae bacterium]|nr:hypothetical protein [Oceanospirillaceae bacterium]